ncbi:MAG TPA: YdcF family protein [Steroidobacteraceae bacterium]
MNAEHFIKTPLKPADLLFVFGTRHGVDKCIDLSYELWRTGYCKWLLVSGGITPGSSLTECEIIETGLVSRGVPHESILEEHRAMNTGENVIFSLPILEAAIGLKNIRSVEPILTGRASKDATAIRACGSRKMLCPLLYQHRQIFHAFYLQRSLLAFVRY